ncbi:hypothetical protein F2Z12_10455 [Bacteroides faecis]|nr:hypothetical protein F2Z14_06285 [Bacteroides faecis]KAA5281327.1 hypothetical protein F2Z12_10455 [Bacteroides faecis]
MTARCDGNVMAVIAVTSQAPVSVIIGRNKIKIQGKVITCSSKTSSNRWNKVFHALKQSVPSNETKCFKPWNKVFQAFETS